MRSEEIDKKLREVRWAFGLTDEEPEFVAKCPGYGAELPVYDKNSLPMGYECFHCAAVYEVVEEGRIDFVEEM